MIILTVDGPLGKENKLEDFHVKEISKDEQMLGSNLVAVLRVDETDSSDMIRNAICRMQARFRVSIIMDQGSIVAQTV